MDFEQEDRVRLSLGIWEDFESKMPLGSPHIKLIHAAREEDNRLMKQLISELLPNKQWFAKHIKVILSATVEIMNQICSK